MHGTVCIGDAVNWASPLNRGLVSWWLALPDQQRGNVFRDLCGRNHAALANGPTLQGPVGRRGGYGSLDFAGTAYGVTDATINLQSKYVVSLWLRWTAWQTTSCALQIGIRPILQIERSASAMQALSLDSGTYQFPASAAVDDGRWHKIDVTWEDSVAMSVYTDGVLTTTDSSVNAVHNDTVAVRIGTSNPGTSTVNWNGALDNIQIFNGVCHSADMIRQRYIDDLLGNPSTLNWSRSRAYVEQGGGGGGYSAWWRYHGAQIIGGGLG